MKISSERKKGIIGVIIILIVILIIIVLIFGYVPETCDKFEIYDISVTEEEGFFEDKVKIKVTLINGDNEVYYARNITIKFSEGSFSSDGIERSWEGRDIKPGEKSSDNFNFDMTWGDVKGTVSVYYNDERIDKEEIGYNWDSEHGDPTICYWIGIIVSIIILIVVIRIYFFPGEKVKQIIKMREEGKVEPLCQALKDNDKSIRKKAAIALGKIGDKKAIEPLRQALKDKEELVQTAARESLSAIRDKESLVRVKAIKDLVKKKDENLIESLNQALKDDAVSVRKVALKGLIKIGDASVVEPLCQALKDKDQEIRWDATKALGKLRDKRAVESLIQTLKDNDKFVRFSAADALGKIGDERAVESLIQALKDNNNDIRDRAAGALEVIGDKRAIEPLRQILKSVEYGTGSYFIIKSAIDTIKEKNRGQRKVKQD